uniref:Uncharacterized protein n=1 Tax=Romanomermis culicivorax TaxID=13658 RepID=A0A915KR91_ROMCU
MKSRRKPGNLDVNFDACDWLRRPSMVDELDLVGKKLLTLFGRLEGTADGLMATKTSNVY